jgi:hypothetical protein
MISTIGGHGCNLGDDIGINVTRSLEDLTGNFGVYYKKEDYN